MGSASGSALQSAGICSSIVFDMDYVNGIRVRWQDLLIFATIVGLLATAGKTWYVNDYRLEQVEQRMQAVEQRLAVLERNTTEIQTRLFDVLQKSEKH